MCFFMLSGFTKGEVSNEKAGSPAFSFEAFRIKNAHQYTLKLR